jgi:hypothetical protein
MPRIDSPQVSNLTFQAGAEVTDSNFTGSFSGSFVGDGASLLNLNMDAGTVSASAEGDAQGQIKLNGVNVDINALGTGDAPQFATIEVGHASDTTLSRASAGDVNVEGNIVYRAGGTDVPVTDGGTGASTLTDGGVLLGSGTGAITAMAVLADGEMIVGDGTGDPVAESGNTLRTSIGVGTGDSPTFTGLTLSGDLTVNGTTTTVNSNTLNIGDNIIALNGVGSTLGGIAVNDANSDSGSLLWDGTNNYWIAGATGSESKILLANGDNVVSSSAMVVEHLPAGTVSGSSNQARLVDISGLAVTDGGVIVGDGSNFVLETGGTARTSLGLGTGDDVQFDSFGVGTAASGTTGEIRATNDITSFYSSDERLKENIQELDGALDKVKALRGVTFDWKELSDEEKETIHSHEGHDLGVIAQEVQAQYPELVTERGHGHLAVDYAKLTAVLIQAVKELSAKVDGLSK